VPGAMVQQYLCGAEMVDSFSLGPLLPNVGIFHIVYSNVNNKKGTVTLSYTACREMLPDPAVYTDCLRESFDELKAATLPTAKTKTKTKAKVKVKAKTKARAKVKAAGTRRMKAS
jgi:diacylglycerol O-acyltransferase / wax synthase